MKYVLALLSALGALALSAVPATAVPPEKAWICHGTGSSSNPFVLLHVPTNSAHWEKHLPDGRDKVPNLSDPQQDPGPRNFTCGEPGSPPTPPFRGTITFALDPALCAPGEIGVPGFTVTQTFEPEKKKHGKAKVQVIENGEVVREVVIFQYPFTCVPLIGGPAGPAGPQGPAGPAGPAGPKTSCTSRRVSAWVLVVRRNVRVTALRASVEGRRAPVTRGRTRNGRVKYTVRINLRGLKVPGAYVARVRYRVNGRRNVKIHLFRVCVGANPLGARPEHPNRFAITVL